MYVMRIIIQLAKMNWKGYGILHRSTAAAGGSYRGKTRMLQSEYPNGQMNDRKKWIWKYEFLGVEKLLSRGISVIIL